MQDYDQFLIAGAWVSPANGNTHFQNVIDPSTEQPIARVALGEARDIDNAVKAARSAFPEFSATTPQYRRELIERTLKVFERRREELAQALSREMGAPITLARGQQTEFFAAHTQVMLDVLDRFLFETRQGSTRIRQEPIGVVGFITPWNWPINQLICKILPGLASGCTMVLKPSEVAPVNAIMIAEFLCEAGVPPGVFNLVNGLGAEVGNALSSHPDVDMISITGSTNTGIACAQRGAANLKRLHAELGGKSANIILDGDHFEDAVRDGMRPLILNAGQNCNAPSRMLVHQSQMNRAAEILQRFSESVQIGPPSDPKTELGPVVSQRQFDRIQSLIRRGIDEGQTLAVGGLGKPAGFDVGYYVRPTVFTDVAPHSVVAQDEIFGPVLVVIPYASVGEAIEIANDTRYGLSNYVSNAPSVDAAYAIAKKLRSGNVHINNAAFELSSPYGGYKYSGSGREWGEYGLSDFMEYKAVFGVTQ